MKLNLVVVDRDNALGFQIEFWNKNRKKMMKEMKCRKLFFHVLCLD